MKRIFYLIAVCVVMMSVSGCYRHRYPYDKLAEADGLMEEHYDSAWTILNAIDTAAISSEANRAYYALLYAQCQYKQYIYETDDSLISTAVDYYTRHDDRRKLMRSYYYRGLIHMTNNAYAKSVSDVVMAERLARRLEDTLFLARTNKTLADLYNRAYNVKEAINRRKSAIEYYKVIPGKERNALFCTVDLAKNYSPDGNHDKSLHILDSLLAVVPASDTVLLSYIYGTYIFTYYYAEKPSKAVESFYRLKELSPDSYSGYAPVPKIAQNFMNCGQIDSANYYLALYPENCLDGYNDLYYAVKYELAKMAGRYDSALVNLEKECIISNSKEGKMFSDNIAVVEKNSIERENDENLVRISRLSSTLMILSVILIILMLIAGLLRFKVLYQRKKLEEKLFAVDQLTREINNLETDLKKVYVEKQTAAALEESRTEKVRLQSQRLSKHNKMLEGAFGKQLEMLDILSKEYFEKKNGGETVRSSMLKTFEKEFHKLSNKSSLKRFEDVVNRSRNNIIEIIRTEIPNLSETDISLITLQLAGFSAKSICVILDWQLGNFYNRRLRIKEKINTSGATHAPMLLSALGIKQKKE